MKSSLTSDATVRALLDAAPDGVLLTDSDGTIVLVNAACARIFGYEQQELRGTSVETLVPDYIRPKHADLRRSFFDGPRTRPMGIGLDLLAQRKDKSTIPVEISLSPFDFEGKHGAIAVIRDVTDQRKMQRDLRRSNEELEQFAYVASHDLQEPLRMVSGYTQLLKRRYADKLDKDAGEYIDFAVDGVKRMQSLINDLLSFSRLSSRGKEFVPVVVGEVVEQALANVEATVKDTNAKITVDAMPTVMGDRTQLIQLVQNLVSNALKFSSPDGRPEIVIGAARDGAHWHLWIQDNGIGIEPEYREKVFVIFQRLHGRDKYPGTGIGLAICKKIVDRHGGRIWITSTEPHGTSFHFTLSDRETT